MIKTVTGNVDKSEISNVLSHEHIQCVSNDMISCFGDKWYNIQKLEQLSVKILSELKRKYNINLFVDGTPVDLGRNVKLLKSISEKSGVKIIASTGLYYYPSLLTNARSSEEIADIFSYECENGMEGTGIKPGILKCAAEAQSMSGDTAKRISALSIVQQKTKLPMYFHCSHNGNIVFDAIKIFEKYSVNPNKIIIGHASRRLEDDYLENILKEGYFIDIDQSRKGDENTVAEVVCRLCDKGFEKKIMFSQDRTIYSDFDSPNSSSFYLPEEVLIERFSFFSKNIIPTLKRFGCDDKQCELFMRENALEVLDNV